MPFLASGAAVVSYSFVKNETRSARLFEVVVPYNKVSNERLVANLDVDQACDKEPAKDETAKRKQYHKFCP